MTTLNSYPIAVVLLLCAAYAGGLTSQHESEPQKQVTDTLRQMYDAEKRRDLQFVLSHLSDDFAEVAGNGKVYHRSDIEAGWADVSLKDYKLSDCIFNLVAPDAAYLSCILEVDAMYKGQPLPGHFRVTWLWTFEKGSWLLRFEQGTVIPDQKAEKPAT